MTATKMPFIVKRRGVIPPDGVVARSSLRPCHATDGYTGYSCIQCSMKTDSHRSREPKLGTMKQPKSWGDIGIAASLCYCRLKNRNPISSNRQIRAVAGERWISYCAIAQTCRVGLARSCFTALAHESTTTLIRLLVGWPWDEGRR